MQKKQVQMSEIRFYLEEMVQLGLANELEERVYEDMQWDVKAEKVRLLQVYKRMQQWYGMKF